MMADAFRARERPTAPGAPAPQGWDCVFRRATPADHDAVVAIVFETLRAFDIEPDPEGLDADVTRFGSPGDAAIFELVAEVDGKVVGSIALRDRGDTTGHISKFFVDAAHRAGGIGRELLARSVAEARRRGLRVLDLETRAQFHAAIHLYESTGWRRGPDPHSVCDRTYRLFLE